MASLMDIGRSAVNAQREALNVTGQNIANIGTEGYRRREADLTEVIGSQSELVAKTSQSGLGVQLGEIRRAFSSYLTDSSRSASSRFESADAFETKIIQLQNLLLPREGDLGTIMNAFFKELSAIAALPGDMAPRAAALEQGKTLAASFNTTAGVLDDLADNALGQLEATVSEVNLLTSSLAQVNGRLRSSNLGGTPPNALLDERDRLIDQLSKRLNVTVVIGERFEADVRIGNSHLGPALVSGEDAIALTSVMTDEQAIKYKLGTNTFISNVDGGAVKGLHDAYSATKSAISELDGLARKIVSDMNNQHQQGIDLEGDLGISMFTSAGFELESNFRNRGNVVAELNKSPGVIDAFDYIEFSYSASNNMWEGRDGDGISVGVGRGKVQFAGSVINFSGTPQDGDSIVLSRQSGDAARISFLLTRGQQFAAASTLKVSAGAGNEGIATLETSVGKSTSSGLEPINNILKNHLSPVAATDFIRDGIMAVIPAGTETIELASLKTQPLMEVSTSDISKLQSISFTLDGTVHSFDLNAADVGRDKWQHGSEIAVLLNSGMIKSTATVGTDLSGMTIGIGPEFNQIKPTTGNLSATLAGVTVSASPTFLNSAGAASSPTSITVGSGTASHELTMLSTSGLLTIDIDGVSVSASGSTTLNTGATNFADAVNANSLLNEIGIRAIASTDGSGKVVLSSVDKFVAAVNDDATLNEKGLSAVVNADGSISLGGNYVANAKISLKDLGVFASGFNGGLVLASGNLGASGAAKPFTDATFKLTTGGSLKAEISAAKPASDIQIFTREGRQIAGNPMTAADAAVLLTPLNGFVSDAEYRADYLTAFDGVGYRGMTVNTFKSDGLNRLELGVSNLGSKRASAPLLAQATEANKAMPKNNTNAQTVTVAAANGVQRSVTIPAGVAADYVSDVLSAELAPLGIAVSAQTRAVLEVPDLSSGSIGFDLSGDNITPFSIVSSITKGNLSGLADAINYRSDDTGITATLTNDAKKLVLDHASGSDIFISNISAGSVGMDISVLDASYQPITAVEVNLNSAGAASTPTNITVGSGTAANELTMASTSGSLIIDIEGVSITAAGSTTLNTGVANFVTAVNANPTLSGYGIRAIASTDGSGKVELLSNTQSLTHNTRVSGQVSFTSKSGFSLQSSLDLTKTNTALPDQNMGGMVGRDFAIAGTSASLTFASNGEIDGAATNVEGTKSQAPSASYNVVLNAAGGPFDVVVNSGETDEPTSERIAAVAASKMRAQAPVPSITGAPIPSLPPVGSFSRFSLDGAEYVLERASTGLKITGPEEDRLVLNTVNVYSGASSASGEKVLLGQSITLSVSGGSVSGQAPTPKFDTNASLFGFGTGSTFTSGATVLSSVDPKVTHKAQSALQGRKFTLPSVGGSKTMNAFVNGFGIGITLKSNMPTAMTNITAGTGPSHNILTADNTAATTSLSATILGTSVPVTVAVAAGAAITSAEMDARSSALAAAINAKAGVGYDADAVSSLARPAATTIAINGTFSNTGNTHAGFDSAREVTVSSVSDESGVNFTISGTDMYGNTLTETIVGGTSSSTVATTEKFLTVTQVVSSARPAGNISVGIKLLTATGSTNGSGNVALSGDVVSLTTNETVGATQPATLSPASAVVITTLEDLSDKTFTITGTDANGATLTETVKGTSTGSTLTSGGLFASVTNVSLKNTTSEALASSTLNITIGISTDLDSIATATPANGSIPFTGSSAASNAFGSDGSIAHISGTTLKLTPTTATSSTTASIAIEGVMVTVADIQLANFVATPTSPNGDTSVTADPLTKANNYASRFATAINENTELVAKGLTATASLNGSGEVSVRRLTTSLYPMAKSTSIHLQADLINGPINITGSGTATSLGFKVAEANLLVTEDGLTANSTGGQAVEISGTGSSLAESRLQLSGLPKEELIVVIAGGGARRISAEYTILDTANVEPLKQENSYEVKMIDAASGRVELFDKATGHSIATRISNGNVQFDSDGIQFNLNGNSSTGDIFGVLTGQRSAGDARNMDNIMDLASTSVGRSSFQDDFRSIAAAVGSTLESSRLSKLSAEAVRDAAVAAEDEVSGVNMDEEAGKLISQQQAYQAAARILQTAKEMFDTLLRI